jgi:transglutaminase-like putative cysteine protease
LETVPPPGVAKLQGADASHAWVSVFCPGLGWVDVDPTNDLFPRDRHIVLAWGRDFADVSPLKGVMHGGGAQVVEVGVDVVSMSEG